MNNHVKESKYIPEQAAQLALSASPIRINIENRDTPLELRVSFPAEGTKMPIILLSHGHGPSLYLSSKEGYTPLARYYAEQGFVVIQPTHASSRAAGLNSNHPDAPLFLNERVLEMKAILDQLDAIESTVPTLMNRLDKERIAIVGHSAGSLTAAMLLGMQLFTSQDSTEHSLVGNKVNIADDRIKAGILMAAVGKGGDDLIPSARENYPTLNPDYTTMTTKNLVVYGDNDVSTHFTTRDADWHADPYHQSKASDHLLSLIGGKHGLGGVAGYDAKETDDEDPDRLAITQKMTSAYLKSALYDDINKWQQACDALAKFAPSHAKVTSKI